MSKIKIVTDSTAYIDRSFVQEHQVTVVPLTVHFEGNVEEEGFPGEFDSFFKRLKKSEDFPTTSQPPVGAFVKVYEDALESDFEVITLCISSKLSGTYNSATTAASLTNQDQISVIDTETTAANLRALVELTIQLVAKGLTREEIVKEIEAQKKRTGICLTVDTLEYLKRGGRLSNTQAFIGSLLNIRPIIGLKEGKLEPIGKVRGKKKALEKMIEEIPKESKFIRICHIDALEEAQDVSNMLKKHFPDVPVYIEELGPVIGSHLGPKALGICHQY